MPEGVEQGFAADPVNLVPDRRSKNDRRPLDNHAIGSPAVGELLWYSREGGLELVRAVRRPQATDGVAAFLGDAAHQVEHARKRRHRGRIRGQAIDGDVQLHRCAHESLQQGIVQLLRNVRPFREALFEPDVELFRDLTDAQPIGAPSRSEEHTSELQSQSNLVCRLLLEKKNYYVATT